MVRLDEGGRAAGEILLLSPPAPLRPWVQHVSIQPGPARHCRELWRVVPDTCGHVIVTAMEDGSARCRVVGARTVHADIDVARRVFTVALRLQPGAISALIRDRAEVLTDRSIDVRDALPGDDGRMLAEMGGCSARHVARQLIAIVGARLERAPVPLPRGLLSRARRVEDLQSALGMRARALHARMRASVGLAPKRALRIERLYVALRHAGRGASIASAAVAAGYSDQPHFTRETRALLGESPAAWHGRAETFKTGR